MLRVGGIVLCGGKSARMGVPKALLPFGGEVMVQRVARVLAEVVSPVVVVAARGQELPGFAAGTLLAGTLLAVDERPERGPLEGLAAGLAAIGGQANAVYLTSCDVPLLAPAFVRRMVEALGQADIAVAVEDVEGKRFRHPLAGVYRTGVLADVRRLLGEDRLRLVDLLDEVATQYVDAEALRGVDPELGSLRNVNRPEDYFAAAAAAGWIVPAEVRAKLLGS